MLAYCGFLGALATPLPHISPPGRQLMRPLVESSTTGPDHYRELDERGREDGGSGPLGRGFSYAFRLS